MPDANPRAGDEDATITSQAPPLPAADSPAPPPVGVPESGTGNAKGEVPAGADQERPKQQGRRSRRQRGQGSVPNGAKDAPGEPKAAPTAGHGVPGRLVRGLRKKPDPSQPTPAIGDTRPAPPEPDRRRRRGSRGASMAPVEAALPVAAATDTDPPGAPGRSRSPRRLGRYLMCVQVRPQATQIAVLEGRQLVEHWVSRPQSDSNEMVGNIYMGRVQNVLPGMEAAFVDIGTPKNAVLYRGDVSPAALEEEPELEGEAPSRPRPARRIEELLRPGQRILCQVTKNPIGAKGARLTQAVSLPGRFCVLVPDGQAAGISKRLPEDERKRLRGIVEEIRPDGQGVIVRTAAQGLPGEEIAADIRRLQHTWGEVQALAARVHAPALLYTEPPLAVRIIREELNANYRSVVIDDPALHRDISGYVRAISPALADRVEYYDPHTNPLSLFDRYHVHEQLHKALDRKVWLPSGGSLIIERTEALTVIDVNTGRNVGSSSLEETVFNNNLEAAEEIARQLRLRDIGGIIVIDFIDMEIRENRERVAAALRNALARDKTRTQVFEISELGLVEMTRKRVSEGLVEALSTTCSVCGGRGIVLDDATLSGL